jgi:CubicO group peptidase (beta-lactamase class C family)
VTLGDLADRRADGHDEEGKRVPPWHLDALAGAGAIRSTAFDLLRFLKANLAPGTTSLGRAITRSHQIQYRDDDDRVAYGWFVTKTGRYWHNGQTAGHHCIVMWDPTRREGVVVLADSGMIFDRVGVELMRILRGEAPSLELPKVVEVAPEALDELVGTYTLDEKRSVSIVREGGRLYTQITGQNRFRLFPESETSFRLRAVEAQVTFELSRGKATALSIHQGGAKTRAAKKP